MFSLEQLGFSAFFQEQISLTSKTLMPVRITGVHTTTSRKIFLINDGGLVIDTPGMREFGLLESQLEESELFEDILALARDCRYRDCNHEGEPECAVLLAIAEGRLAEGRLLSMRKLKKEEDFERRRRDAKGQADAKKRWKSITKELKHHPKKNRWS